MKTRNYAVLMSTLLASGVSGMDVAEYWRNRGLIDVVSSTETTLSLKVRNFPGFVWHNYITPPVHERLSGYIGDNEHLVLSTDMETVLGDGFGLWIYFNPALFKEQQNGFRIVERFKLRNSGLTNNVMYLALGDTPVTMGEEDVEMIMEMGVWKTPGEAFPVRAYIPSEEVADVFREEGRRYSAWKRKADGLPPLREKPQPPMPEPETSAADTPPVASEDDAETESIAPPKDEPPASPPVITDETTLPAVEEPVFDEGGGKMTFPPNRTWLHVGVGILAIVGGVAVWVIGRMRK